MELDSESSVHLVSQRLTPQKDGPGGQGIIDDPCGPIMYYHYGKYRCFESSWLLVFLQYPTAWLTTANRQSFPFSKHNSESGQHQLQMGRQLPRLAEWLANSQRRRFR